MKNLPRLELTENPNKNNDFIIFHKQIKGKHLSTKTYKHSSKSHKKTKSTKKQSKKRHHLKTRKHKKSIFRLLF